MLLQGFLSEKVGLLREHLPQHHEPNLQAVLQFVRTDAKIPHHIRDIKGEIVVNLLEGLQSCPRRRVNRITQISEVMVNISSQVGICQRSERHAGARPLTPRQRRSRGNRSSIHKEGGWFGVLPARECQRVIRHTL